MRFILQGTSGRKVKGPSANSVVTPLIGVSSHIKEIELLSKTVSQNNASVLLVGERGTGKRLIARNIHYFAAGNFSTFFEINCKSFSEDEIKRVFHELKHFIGFDKRISLFVSSINELSKELQQAFLDTIKSAKSSNINLKIICSLENNIDELVNTGNFSSDLYYQLNAVVINVLPLRQRKEDIIPIANYYLNSFNQKSGYAFTDFTESAKEEMENYFWTGNADELINSIQRGFIVGKVPLINSEDLGIGIAAASDTETKTLKEALDAFKKDYVTKVLQENGWNQTKTAKILGIQRTYVIRLINELQIRK